MTLLHHTEQRSDLASQVELDMAAAGHLFNAQTTGRYAANVLQGVELVAATVANTTKPFTGITPEQLGPTVDRIDLERPLPDTAAALKELGRVYLNDAVYFHDTKYAAHLNCPVVIPALVGEAILSAVNSSLDTWDQSAGATLIERRLIDWTAERLGLGKGADGVFTSGGTTSNLQGLLIARNSAVATLRLDPRHEGQRLPALLAGLRIFTSEASHFSISKSASLLGLGYDAVVPVACDSHRRMDPEALSTALADSAARGETPMAIVATAGTTDFGSIDPLEPIAALADTYGIWLHVDAAYGGGLITSLRYRYLLDGIQAANSVTVDYHKTFFQPVSSSALLVRNAADLGHVTLYSDYLNPESAARERIPNQVDKSLQTTRRFDALKLWLTLRLMGADGIGRLLDAAVDLTSDVATILHDDPDFELAAPAQLSTLVFRYLPPGVDPETADALNRRIRKDIFASGEAVIAGTTLAGRHYLKFTLLNAETTVDDIREILVLIRTAGDNYLAGAAA